MDEETRSPDRRVIKLTKAEYASLERAMQWPEEIAKYDRLNKPTPLDEIGLFAAVSRAPSGI